jgi:flagellin-specific chaperone FliS
MTPLRTYSQQQGAAGWTRIDMLLALYDGLIDRLRQAVTALEANDAGTAGPMLMRAQTLVMELLAGVNPEAGDPSSRDLLRLYDFIANAIAQGDRRQLESAIRVLVTLREGFQGIRAEAAQLERDGVIPPLHSPRSVLATG